MLDAVDPSCRKVPQGLLPVAVSGHPGALVVRDGDGRGQRLTWPAGAEVPGVPVDPVAHQLDPAVAGAGLPTDVRGQVLWLDLVGVVAEVSARPGDVPTRSDDARQVGAVVDPAGVGRGAGIAHQQGSRVTVGERLVLRSGVVHRAAGVESDMAVGVHQTGQDPAFHGLDVRTRGWDVIRDPAADDPDLVADLLRSDQDTSLDVQHRRGHPATLSGSGRLLAEELLEALRQVEICRVMGVRVVSGARGTRHAERALDCSGPGSRALVRRGPLLQCALGRVAALALLALLTFGTLPRPCHARNRRHSRDAGATTAPHRTHHLLGLAEALEQAVHLSDAHTRPPGDPGPA